MAQSTLSVSRSNIKGGAIKGDLKAAAFLRGLAVAVFVCASAWAQLPDGPGKTETARICSECHELSRSISLRQDRAGWQATMDKMATLGAKGTPEEFQLVVEYLTRNFPASTVPKINVNTARAIDFEAGLSLLRSQAAAIVAYRAKNGPFKSVEDLEKVPGVDVAKIEARKDRLAF